MIEIFDRECDIFFLSNENDFLAFGRNIFVNLTKNIANEFDKGNFALQIKLLID